MHASDWLAYTLLICVTWTDGSFGSLLSCNPLNLFCRWGNNIYIYPYQPFIRPEAAAVTRPAGVSISLDLSLCCSFCFGVCLIGLLCVYVRMTTWVQGLAYWARMVSLVWLIWFIWSAYHAILLDKMGVIQTYVCSVCLEQQRSKNRVSTQFSSWISIKLALQQHETCPQACCCQLYAFSAVCVCPWSVVINVIVVLLIFVNK